MKKMKAGGVTSIEEKRMGRNLARVANQKSGKSVPMKMASGGVVMRGAGCATKGTKSGGPMG